MTRMTWEAIAEQMLHRRLAREAVVEQMMQVRERYNGDWVLPELGQDATPLIPTIIADAIDHNGMRAASVMPDIIVPALDATKETGKRSRQWAARRRAAWLYVWESSLLNLHLRRACRHYFGYATTAFSVEPNFVLGCPHITVRDPLNCVDTETEILTKRGWLRHDELSVGDEVAGYDLDTGLARWTLCHQVFRHEIDEDMVAVDRRGLSMRLTSEHRAVVHKRLARDANRPGPVHVITADELNSTHYIPRAAEWEDFGDKALGVDLAAMIGWMAAEGNYGPRRSRAVYLSQSQSANPQHVATIDALIERLTATYGADGRRWERTCHSHLPGQREFDHVMVEWKLSRALSDEIRRLMPTKMLGHWCLDLPEVERRALLDAFIDGDGSRYPGQSIIPQATKRNLDVLQAVAVTLGLKTTLGVGPNKWVLYLSPSRRPQSLRSRGVGTTPGPMPRERYTGTVWCPNTGTGTWFARRNGTVFITGNCFPEPKAPEDLSPPVDCGFIYGKSARWLLGNYPISRQVIGDSGWSGSDTDLWDIVEWVDEHDVVLGVLGPRWSDEGGWGYEATNMRPFELKRWPNRAGRCTVVAPQRVTLDKIVAQVSQVIGHVDLQARLLHLDILATEKSIVPDRYILGDSSMVPRLVGGTWKDGRTGEVNIVLDAKGVGELRGTPDPNNKITQDRLERNARVSAGLVPQYGGETFGGARTGRGLDALLSAAVDPRIQECQEVMQTALTDVNRIVADAWLGYWPDRHYTVFSGMVSEREMVEFNPGAEFGELAEQKVVYAIVGTDIVGLNVTLGQLVGTEMMSRGTARASHPYIKDADGEERRVLIEKLNQAVEMQILTRASDPMGGMTPLDMATIVGYVEDGLSLVDAVRKANDEAQARQAALPPPAPDGGLAPETMPGLANPGEGGESQAGGLVPIPEAPQGLQNLDSLLGAMSTPPLGRPAR